MRDERSTAGASSINPRRDNAPVLPLVVIGVVASVIGIALGLIIDWFPTAASPQADPVDTLWDVLIIASVPMFVLVVSVVLYSVWRFRQRPGEENLDGPPVHGNTRLEVIWTVIPAVLILGLCTYAYLVLDDIEEAKANEMVVHVVGQQFTWTFEYGEGKDAVRSNELYIVKDKPVKFEVQARDVLHDFWVPQFRMKIDAVPGITTHYRVTPSRMGTFPVVCAELCGIGHAYMRQNAHVVSQADFDAWMQKLKQPAAPAGGGESGGGETAAVDAKKIFTSGTGGATPCAGCHMLADAGASGNVGPDLDKVLKGKDAAFVKESIVDPNKEVASGYSPGIMPPNYGQTLKPEEVDALAKYLTEVTNK
jgi:cytochrome c oxidase subunit II